MSNAIKTKLKQTPKLPGVYQFFDAKRSIIYIGKAKNLRNRISSYFRNSKYLSPKTTMMIKHISYFEWIVVRNEVEALMTEANMVKKYQPKYNIDLRDDKSYPFIRITNEPYPQVVLTRKIIKDGSKYYGPFTDIKLLKMTLKALYKIFQIRSCDYYIDKKAIKEKKIAICLDYHIKKCEGPCEGLVSRNHYLDMINRVEDFMKGKTHHTELYLKNRMDDASSCHNYEDAAIYRDQLQAIKSFKNKQSHVATDFEERDVIALAKEGEIGIGVILRIRNGRIFSRDKLSMRRLEDQDDFNMKTIITRFYLDSDFIPKEISLQNKPKNEIGLISWLKKKRNGSVRFSYPQRGKKAKEIRITYQNAKLLLGEWLVNREKIKDQAPKILRQLKEDLKLHINPRRIEAFDISHLGGTNTVASMVCFIDSKPKKKEYRKYNLQKIKGIDDFSAIREVVFRRYKRIKDSQGPLPDLILIDGGKGQLNVAVSTMKKLGLGYIPIIGLAKKLEQIFIPGFSEPQSIHKQSTGLILLQRIRNEAHRFALAYQKQKRKKTMTKSIFSSVSGVGNKRLQSLLKVFDGPETIKNLSPELIKAETGIPIKVAKEIVITAKNFSSTLK